MVSRIRETSQDHSIMEVTIRLEMWQTDQEGHDHRREEQLEVRVAHRLGLGFSTCRITTLRKFYRIKLQVKGSKRRRHTRPLCQSTPYKNGARNFGRLEPVDSKRSGSYSEMLARKITRQLRHS